MRANKFLGLAAAVSGMAIVAAAFGAHRLGGDRNREPGCQRHCDQQLHDQHGGSGLRLV